MTKCTNCDESVGEDVKFCPHCGFPIRCFRCATRLAVNAKFCPNCGTATNHSLSQHGSKLIATSIAAPPLPPAFEFGSSSSSIFSEDNESVQRSWYEQTWGVVSLLILFWIVGVIVLWRSKYFTTGQKIALSIVTFIVDYILLIFIRIFIFQLIYR